MNKEIIIVEGQHVARHWYDAPNWIATLLRAAFKLHFLIVWLRNRYDSA